MTRTLRSLTFSALAVAAMFCAVTSQADDAKEMARVEVGQEAPDFTLPDPAGTDFTLSALRGEKNVLMVFFRGAW